MLHRRQFLVAAGFGAVSIGISKLAMAGAETPSTRPATPAKIVAGPLLTNVTDTGVTVITAVDALSTLTVEYGLTAALGQVAVAGDAGLVAIADDVHKVRLENLSPGTRYHYRVRLTQIDFKNAYSVHRAGEWVSDVRTFRTLDPNQDLCSFSVINDTHEVRNTLRALGGRIKSTPADFTFWNGDVFNQVTDVPQMTRQLVGFMGDNAVAASQPMQLLRGNHDVRGIMARQLDRFTDISGGRYYGSFRHGPVAFITLDSGEDKPDAHPVYAGLNDFAAFRSEQREWLKTELKKPHVTSAPFRVVFVHIPLRWTDESQPGDWCSDGRAKWHDLLVDAKVDLVISGHTHRHAFLPADGQFPYAQLVGGGPVLKAATFIEAKADAKKMTVAMSKATGEPIDCYSFSSRPA